MLFAMYLADPGISTGFLDFAQGEYSFGWSSIITLSIASLAGIVTAVISRDIMTGAIVTLVTTMTGWLVIPTNFTAGLPTDIQIFMITIFGIIWGMAMIGFFRGFEP